MAQGQEAGIEVLLNVYDVTSTPGDPRSTTVRLNRITRELGLGGVFHGAIQIGATAQLASPEPLELSFGWCERGTGVYAVHACQNPMYQYRETLSLGYTPKTAEEIRGIIQELKLTWPGSSYDLLTRNCCHFCEDLAARLGVAPVPGWLNRFAVGAAATVNMTQETVKTVQEIGQELGRLSGESLSFLKASWAKTVAAASQQQHLLAERLQQQQWLRLQREGAAAGGSPRAAAAGAGSRSTPHMHAPAGREEDGWGEQQQQHRSASDACIAGANSSCRAAPAWLPGGGGFPVRPGNGSGSGISSSSSSAALAASAASAGQSLLAGFQQGGRQLKVLTSKLGAHLMQQQQQERSLAAAASLQAAGAGPRPGQASSPVWQQQQQMHQQPEYAGTSPGSKLQQPAEQEQQQELLQQQQHAGSGFIPAVQPKLAPQFCVDGGDAVADPLASLLLEDGAAPGGSSSQVSGSPPTNQQPATVSQAVHAAVDLLS